MEKPDTVIAVFADHLAAETAAEKPRSGRLRDEKSQRCGQRIPHRRKGRRILHHWRPREVLGRAGCVLGGLWGWFFGGLFLMIPGVGHVVVLGYLAAMAMSAIETAVVVGGLGALGAALFSIGIPKNSVIQYETALKADNFLVMAHGTAEEINRAKAILGTANAARIDVHTGIIAAEPAHIPVLAASKSPAQIGRSGKLCWTRPGMQNNRGAHYIGVMTDEPYAREARSRQRARKP